jgi:predicted alpha/beta-fold hydrolase
VFPYRAPAWLPGGHLQTIYASLVAPRPRVTYRRTRWDTPDADFIDLDWVERDSGFSIRDSENTPLVVLFHGLEGSSRSHYATSIMHAAHVRGWRGVVIHFRGCSGELNRLPRAYHSGDSVEVGWILGRLRQEHPHSLLFAVGVSLGGNALLKWLGEQGAAAHAVLTRACAVSAPVDLMASGAALGHGFNLLYARHFLSTMKRKSLAKLARFPGLFDRRRMLAARTLREFDDVVTAPLHGFRNTDDYWTRASSKPLLRNISIPALMINARNDPFLPPHALPHPHEVSQHVTLDFPAAGGHVGFVSGTFPGNLNWLAQRPLAFFSGT